LLARFPKIRETLIVPLSRRNPHRIFTRDGTEKEIQFLKIKVKLCLVRGREAIITVSSMKAMHCPGSAMLLFEGPFGTILHTGMKTPLIMHTYTVP